MAWKNYGIDKVKMQFITSVQMPSLVYKALLVAGKPSQSVYIQHAVCEALARDLDIPIEDLLKDLPKPRGAESDVMGGLRARKNFYPGSNSNTSEEVR